MYGRYTRVVRGSTGGAGLGPGLEVELDDGVAFIVRTKGPRAWEPSLVHPACLLGLGEGGSDTHAFSGPETRISDLEVRHEGVGPSSLATPSHESRHDARRFTTLQVDLHAEASLGPKIDEAHTESIREIEQLTGRHAQLERSRPAPLEKVGGVMRDRRVLELLAHPRHPRIVRTSDLLVQRREGRPIRGETRSVRS
jgi:hypothetical protein